jgi:hypothetical protein
MPVTITYDGAAPTVGADADTWGTEINVGALAKIKVDLDALATLTNAEETEQTATIARVTAVETNYVHTGDIKFGLYSSAPAGWVKMDGGTIGNASSGATRANADTAALFAVLWALDATDSPILTSAGAGSTRGASAAADYAANKRLTVPDFRGEFMRGLDDSRGVDAARRLGSAQSDELKAHTHTLPVYSNTNSGTGIEDGDFSGTLQSSVSGSTGGTETRPRNVAALAVIKL